MISTITDRIRAGYMTAFSLLFIAYLLIFYSTRQFNTQANYMNEMNQTITRFELIVSEMKDAETGARGFLIMSDSSFLEPLFQSRETVASLIKDVRAENPENLFLQKQLDSLVIYCDAKFGIIDSSIAEFRTNNESISPAIKSKGGRGKYYMDQIRYLTQRMKDSAEIRLSERKAEMETVKNTIAIINATALLVAILLAFYSMTTFNRENKAKNNYRLELEKKLADLKKANSELTQLRSLEKFTATGRIARTIVHEVRNPLTNISLAGEQLRDFLTGHEEGNGLLDMINRNTVRINQLVGELLHSTKFAELAPKEIPLNTLLDNALLQAKDRLSLKELKVIKRYAAGENLVRVDKSKIEIAFLNIIVNAMEAMEAGKGVLTITTDRLGDYYRIQITDNGPGMQADTVSKIFEPYFTSKSGGNGLGLTNTQNIILNHKGTIEVESTPGVGTSFIISLQKI